MVFQRNSTFVQTPIFNGLFQSRFGEPAEIRQLLFEVTIAIQHSVMSHEFFGVNNRPLVIGDEERIPTSLILANLLRFS